MTEHALELLQVPARLAGLAYDGMLDGGGGAHALLALGVLLVLATALLDRRSSAGTLGALAPATLPTTPGAPWEGSAAGSPGVLGQVVDASRGREAALDVQTPGGGE